MAVIAGIGVISQPNIEQTVELKLQALWNRQPSAPHGLPPRWTGRVRSLGFEAVVLGTLLAVVALLFLRKRESCAAWADKPKQVLLTAAFLMLMLWLPVALWGHSSVLFGKRIWFLGDDPMISMRYARNLANGNGWVWNAGEHVEGYTNPLWTMLMAGCHLIIPSDLHTSLSVMILNIIISLWILWLLHRLTDAFGGNSWVKAGVLFAFVLNRNLLSMSMAGFEIPLLTALMLWALLRIVSESKTGNPSVWTYVIIGIMALVRSDAIVPAMLLTAYSFFLQKKKKQVLFYVIIMLVFPALHLLFRQLYYGEWLPNTAYLKVGQVESRWIPGLHYALGFMKAYFVYIAAAIFGLCFTRKKISLFLGGLVLLYSGYVVYAGGDAFHHYRFFLPVLPLLFLMAFLGIEKLHIRKKAQALMTLLFMAAMPMVFPGYSLLSLLPRPADIRNVELGLMIRANTSPDARVADAWAGNPFYFSDRYGIDLLGKNDPVIARQPVRDASAKVGHNKFDYDYSLGQLKPDYVIGNFKLPITDVDMKSYMTGDWAAAGALYFHPLFQEHGLPNPVKADTWRSIFVMDWSQAYGQREEAWHPPEW